MRGPDDCCRVCLFWRDDGNRRVGVCRRFPPSVIARPGDRQYVEFPVISAGEWCGEHVREAVARASSERLGDDVSGAIARIIDPAAFRPDHDVRGVGDKHLIAGVRAKRRNTAFAKAREIRSLLKLER